MAKKQKELLESKIKLKKEVGVLKPVKDRSIAVFSPSDDNLS